MFNLESVIGISKKRHDYIVEDIQLDDVQTIQSKELGTLKVSKTFTKMLERVDDLNIIIIIHKCKYRVNLYERQLHNIVLQI